MTLTVLSVAYPLAPVRPDTAGGAEQVLATLDRALVAQGHRSLVVAQQGSEVAGTLIPVPLQAGPLGDAQKRAAQAACAAAIRAALQDHAVDLVHCHGIDFATYLPPVGVPVLATLHLPCGWYEADALQPTRPGTWFNAVSADQHHGCPPSSALLPPVENGIDIEAFAGREADRGRFALVLGRICPEKGTHLAIEAARRAAVPLVIAGQVFPYEEHTRYFDTAIRPHLGRMCRFVGPVGSHAKRRLLARARCLLVPSLAPETSSLVTREAAASGLPVIAFPSGALASAVEPGRTGFLVEDVPGMADAIGRADAIDPATCRAVARRRFSADTMVAGYLDRYHTILSHPERHAA